MFPPLDQLLPHSGPAILLSRVLRSEVDMIECEAVVEPRMQYVEGGQADAALALEMMAQTVSSYVGIERSAAGDAPREGYIIGVPKMDFFGGDYAVGTRLRIRACIDFREPPVGRFNAEVYEEDTLRARGILTVYEPPEVEERAESEKNES